VCSVRWAANACLPRPIRAIVTSARCGRRSRRRWARAGNTTALVGTAETVALALLDYYDIGVTTFLIRGFEPYDDAVDFGRELIPRVHEGVSRRESGCSAPVAHIPAQ
jgi:alkanesulfonate monooxygenase SsuD/methylene tetrahydromethanopterin reductase-like flavin-dependent oxidoreductase (luciferase family)